MQSYPKEELKDHSIIFVNALEEYKTKNRELFGIKEMDRFISFSEKKNVCIVDKLHSKSSSLYSLVAKFCIDYCKGSNTFNGKEEKNKTILIDAGNGNNLGYVYISLINRALKSEFDFRKVLDNTIITRAFTFYQLANIVLKEIPTLMKRLDGNIQIIVMDLLGTLNSSSLIEPSKQNKADSKDGFIGSNKDVEPTINMLDEMIDQLIEFSDKYFVIVHYNANKNPNLRASFIPSKFTNSVEIIENNDIRTSEGNDSMRIIPKTRLSLANNEKGIVNG